MYVCPSCSEEIPDKVKKRSDECPFCHTPWLPDDVDEVEDEPEPAEKKPEGWGDEFRPSSSPAAAGEGSAAAAEPEKKSKLGLILVIVLLVLGGGGAGVYFGVLKKGDKSGKGAKGAQASGMSEDEFSSMQRWYRKARKIIADYMGNTCQEYYNADYKYYSYLVPKKSNLKRGNKNVQILSFELELRPDPKAKPQGKLDVFACPGKIALIQKNHPYVIEAKVWERRQVFGAVLKYADIEIKGKLTGYLGKNTKFRSLASQTHKGFAFSGLKKAPDPGLKALSNPLPFHMEAGVKHFRLANLLWTKVAPGKYIQGTWRLELKTNELKRKIKDWALACESIKRHKFGKLPRPKEGQATFDKMHQAGKQVMKDICNSLVKISRSVDPWKQADINDAVSTLAKARTIWGNQVFKPLQAAAKKVGSPLLAKPL